MPKQNLLIKGSYMEIYEILHKDHEKIKLLLNDLINLDEDSEKKHVLIAQVRDELIPHSRAEETVFYNSLREMDQAKDIIMHSYKEHIKAEALLKTLQAKEKIDLDWKSTAKKLKEALEHHIQEEEEKIFSVAKLLFTDEEATQFAAAFEKMKPEIRKENFLGTTIDLIRNLMPPRFTSSLKKSDSPPPPSNP